MDFIENIKDECIIICEEQNKSKILKQLTDAKTLKNIKFYTKKQLYKNLYFNYNEETIIYLMKKQNYKYEVAKEILDNLIYIDNQKYKSEKLNQLNSLKNELEKQKLLTYNEKILKSMSNKEIYFYGYNYFDKFDKKIINKLNNTSKINIINKKNNDYNHLVYELETIEDEIEFIAQSICELIENGIEVNNIKLTNIDKNYLQPIKRIFGLYKLPIIIEKTTIYQTKIGQYFIKNYTTMEETINKLINDFSEKDIINKIVNICNKYIAYNEDKYLKELIINDLKKTYITNQKYKNQIEIINYNEMIDDNQYVFFINFNQGSIPKAIKDEQYLTDEEKKELQISTSIEINKLEKENIKKVIQTTKNLKITYKTKIGKNEFYKSSLIEELNFDIKKQELDNKNSYSIIANKIRLAKKLDNYYKYNQIDETLKILYNNYKIPYNEYDNNYKNINKQELYDYLNNKLQLSYSSMDKYNKCAFSYYISNILKLDPYETNFAAKIGSIFHYCLELGIKQEININDTVENYIKQQNYEFSNKEKFFIEKIKQEIQFVINTIKEQFQHCNLKNVLTEEEIIINKTKTLEVSFKGIIDKLLYNDDNIVAIIDYKTGSTNIKLDLIDYGLSMQLPVYLYLASNCQKFTNPSFAGFYLQQVLHTEIIQDNKYTYEEQKTQNLKLNGYSNDNKKIINEFDNTYENSKIINGLKITKNEEFSKTSKIINDDQINELINKVDKTINKVIEQIEQANFDINPKIINGQNVSCQYCKYKDLCFKTEKNNEYIDIIK